MKEEKGCKGKRNMVAIAVKQANKSAKWKGCAPHEGPGWQAFFLSLKSDCLPFPDDLGQPDRLIKKVRQDIVVDKKGIPLDELIEPDRQRCPSHGARAVPGPVAAGPAR